VPLAVGAGLASKLKDKDDVAVCYFGDGAIEEGAVHESLNLARVLDAPVLFVVENNLFSSHMHISLRQSSDTTARFADAHNIPFEVVDGNDVTAVADAADRLVSQARSGNGPGFLEAVTFRWLGHVDWREDVDVGVKRSSENLAEWRARDPISRLEGALVASGEWSLDQGEALRSEINEDILGFWETAMEDPWPENEALLDCVYATRTDISDG
jgi:pyruvate dehydrogenase E1 component alpha subunit